MSNLKINISGTETDLSSVAASPTTNHESSNKVYLPNYAFNDAVQNEYTKANSGYNLSYYGLPLSDFYDAPFYYNGSKIPFALYGSTPSIGSSLYGTSIVLSSGNHIKITCRKGSSKYPSLYREGSSFATGNARFFLMQAGGGGGGYASWQTAVHGTGGGGGGSGAWILLYVAFKKAGIDSSNYISFYTADTNNTNRNTDGADVAVYYNGSTLLATAGGGKHGNGRSGGAGGTVSYSAITLINDNYLYVKIVDSGSGCAGGQGGRTSGWSFGKPTSDAEPQAGTNFSNYVSKGYVNSSIYVSYSGGDKGNNQSYWGGYGGGGGASIFSNGADGGDSSAGPSMSSYSYGVGGGGGAAQSYTEKLCNPGLGGKAIVHWF